MKRIASVWCPNWPMTNRLRRSARSGRPAETAPGRTAAEPSEPFALVETVGGARRLAAVNAEAEAAGLWPGKKLADSLALVPELRTAEHRPELDSRALLALADWCVRFSPAVAPDGTDGLFIDVTGGAAPWGGEGVWLHDLLRRLARAGIPARAAVADTAGAAWALARFGETGLGRAGFGQAGFGQAGAVRIPPGAQARALDSLPIAALRLEAAAAAGLPRLGLTTVGQIAALPRAQLAKRFGAGTLLRLDQALGRADEALPFRRPPTPWFERLGFFDPLSAPEDLQRATGDLLAALCERLAAEGQGARRFEAAFHRADGRSFPVRIGTGLPARDPRRLLKLFVPKLEFVDPGFGVDAVTLTADRVEPLAERQTCLDRPAETEDALAALIDQLGNRLGENRVWRAAPQASHIPERAVARRPAAQKTPAGGWDPERPRPMRLLSRPEPVEAMAVVPDNPPLVFTWRGRRRRIRRAEGPERIAEEWWRDPQAVPDPGRVRDYYAVEDGDGERFWLFRDGLYRTGEAPRWFLHGLFG